MNEELKHNTVVDMIKQKRAPEKFGKGIKPFAVVSKANAIRFGTVASPLILQEKAATRPSDPNSMMDLGACVYALPIQQKLDEQHEKFTEDLFSQHLNTDDGKDIDNNNLDADLNDRDDNEEGGEKMKVEFKEDIETRSKRSILSSRLSEKKKHDMVKALIKRQGSSNTVDKDGKVTKPKDLIKKMEDRL